MKRLFSLLLAVMLVMALAVPASAASLDIVSKDKITIKPGSSYSATDLFDEGFKNVMPGDRISETITIKSGFGFKEDSLKVYMRAIPHTNTDNKPVTGVDVATMDEFLQELTLRVYNMSDEGKQIFKGTAKDLDGLKENVLLGTFRKNGSIKLRVELEVPITLGNKFAHRVGEVDWLFTVEAYDDPSYDNPKTGDYIMIAVAVMAVSAVGLLVILAAKRKKKQ
jgi:LPXTG-motif cell wall-anchored protein